MPTVIVGVLAIMRARHDVENEVQRGALAHIRALGAALDGTLQDARRTVELAASQWADAPDDARETQLLLAPAAPRRADRAGAVDPSIPTASCSYGDPVPPGVDIGSHSFGGYIGDAVFVDGRPTVHLGRAGARPHRRADGRRSSRASISGSCAT